MLDEGFNIERGELNFKEGEGVGIGDEVLFDGFCVVLGDKMSLFDDDGFVVDNGVFDDEGFCMLREGVIVFMDGEGVGIYGDCDILSDGFWFWWGEEVGFIDKVGLGDGFWIWRGEELGFIGMIGLGDGFWWGEEVGFIERVGLGFVDGLCVCWGEEMGFVYGGEWRFNDGCWIWGGEELGFKYGVGFGLFGLMVGFWFWWGEEIGWLFGVGLRIIEGFCVLWGEEMVFGDGVGLVFEEDGLFDIGFCVFWGEDIGLREGEIWEVCGFCVWCGEDDCLEGMGVGDGVLDIGCWIW